MDSSPEGSRDPHRARWTEHLARDVRFGARMFLKNPGFTALAVLSLALGIAANTTVFCWIQNILLRPFPGASRQDELVVVTTPHGTATWDTLSLPDLRDQGKLQQVFAGVIGSFPLRADLTIDRNSEWIYGQLTTANFIEVLGVRPILGRLFLPEEDRQPGAHPVPVISETFWKRRFSGDPSVIGRTVEIERNCFTIVGIVPGAFRGTVTGYNCDFWAPVMMCQEAGGRGRGSLENRSERWLQTQARLRAGVSPAGAQAALDTLAAQIEKAHPESNKDVRFRVLPLWRSPYGGQPLMLPVLGLLQAVSLGVLLIVAVNVANLLLARATRRAKEIGIRLAMGAGRGRLIRQLLTENLLLSLIAGVVGVWVAGWMVGLVHFFIPNSYLPLGFSVSLDSRILVWTFLLTLTTGLLIGLVPALQLSGQPSNEVLKHGGRSSSSGAFRHRALNLLVVSEIALALALLVCAGLCLQGLRTARRTDLGFDPTIGTWGVEVEGYPRQAAEDPSGDFNSVSPGFLAVMRTRLIEGRDFTDRDDRKAPQVAIINETVAVSALGVYGVMAYVVGQRTHDFGVRLALGARRRSVLGLVLRRGLKLIAAGVAVGLPLALAVSRLLANSLYGVRAFDAATFIGVPILLGCVALAACWMPAHRAAQVNPIEALRCE